jgi:tetratricopeptide (TPR) repeat protein
VQDAPWLYEAEKLQGDIHLERALVARDSGKDDDAKREFGLSVAHYQAAAKIGQSDAEVYEGLAEAWVRQVEMAATRGQPTEDAYAAAIETSDKISATEPASTAGPLKKAYAALLTMAISGSGTSSVERVQKCMIEAQAVLAKEPENPYASDVAAGCNAFAADSAQGRGEDPEPLLRKSLALLEPAVRKYPHFLWGINDLANIYVTLGGYLQLHGKPGTTELFEKAIQYENMALDLDAGYLIALQNLLFTYSKVIVQVGSVQELKTTLERVDSVYKICVEKNKQFHQCHINYVMDLARAAIRLQLVDDDVQSLLGRGQEALSRIRALGGSFLDLEQNAALFHLLDAQEKLRRKQDAAAALLLADQAIARCLGMNGQDAMCRTLAAQRVWLDAKLAELAKQPTRDVLLRALEKALEATRSPETYPDAWQTVAETYLRLLQGDDGKAKQRAAWLLAGKVAAGKVFAVNPNHALAQATLGELELENARSQPEGTPKVTAAEAARNALTQAVQSDPLLTRRLGPLLAESRKLATR